MSLDNNEYDVLCPSSGRNGIAINDRGTNSNNSINSKRNGNRNDITIVSIMSETSLAQEAVGV